MVGAGDEYVHDVALVEDFDRFYASTSTRSLAFAAALTRSWADAEDLVQDAYSAAHRRWATVGRYDDPAAWVRRVITNRSASRWRRATREVRALTRLGGRRSNDVEPPNGDPAFWSAVSQLPARQRQVVALHYVDDRSVAEIAVLIGCSEGTVKTHLSRARHALHNQLNDQEVDQ